MWEAGGDNKGPSCVESSPSRVLWFSSCCCDKTLTKSNLREERFVCLTLPGARFITEGGQAGNSSKSWKEKPRGTHWSAYSRAHIQPAFFRSLKAPVEEWGHPQWAGHTDISQQLRQTSTDKPTDRSDPCNSTIDDSLLW